MPFNPKFTITPKINKVLDEIDKVLARHYGFTDEELDFIINYDIKYRMERNYDDNEQEAHTHVWIHDVENVRTWKCGNMGEKHFYHRMKYAWILLQKMFHLCAAR